MNEEILKLLKDNDGSYISGEALSGQLGVTRTAVWKHIRELKADGYSIESSPRKGYRLLKSQDVFNAFEIGYNLQTSILGKNIVYFDSIDSTNNYAKKAAFEGCPEGTVIAADSQTSGRGRLGRDWSSIPGKGIWMSVVLRPPKAPKDIQIITLAASVAVIRALYNTSGIKAGIKWPNDIILDGKKVCGILTEMSCEVDRVSFIVLGIGFNVSQDYDDFHADIRDKAISLKIFNMEKRSVSQHQGFSSKHRIPPHSVVPDRCDLIRGILYELENVYNDILKGDIRDILESWVNSSVTLGRDVLIKDNEMVYTGKAGGLTDEGRLIVNCSDGAVREISAGEVSIRGLLGYV